MRLPAYVLGLVGLTLSACAEGPSTATNAADESSFAALLGIGRAVPGSEMADRVSYADARFHPAAVRVDVEGDGVVTTAAFDTAKMDDVEAKDLEKAALAFVDEYADALAVASDELRLNERGIVDAQGQLALAFDRVVDGSVVDGAYLQVVFAKKGDAWRLAELVNKTYGKVDGLRSNVGDEAPAWETVLGFKPELGRSVAILFPKEARGRITLVQAVRVDVTNPKTGDVFVVVYDPSSGALLQAVDTKQSARLSGEALDRSYFYKDKKYTAPLAGVTINGRESGSDGATTESGIVTVALQNDFVRVRDGGRTVSFSMDASGDAVAREGDVDLPALNTFIAINRVINFAAKRLDTSRIVYFNRPIDVSVNASGTCNAFYNGSITLFAAGGTCGNMGLVNDVIYHEWGHGLDSFTGTRNGITDSAFSEGIGDIVASYLTNDPNMAPGFKTGREQGIRNLDNTAKFPTDRGEAHKEGTIIGGAFWDMREALIARYGAEAGKVKAETIFFRHLLTTDSYQQSYQGALRVDDNDNNPATRSPNHCLITAAFAAHGLAREEADCRDSVDEPTVPSKDASLHLAIIAEENGGSFEFAAAVDGDKTISLCAGTVQECLKGGADDMQFFVDRSGVRIYKSVGKLSPNLLQPFKLTLLAKDRKGVITGYSSFRLDQL